MRVTSERAVVGTMLVLALITLGLQAFVLRPRLWPAGPGLALSGDVVFGQYAAPRPIAVIRPPDISTATGGPVTVVGMFSGSPADRAGIRVGDRATRINLNAPAFMTSPPELIVESIELDLSQPRSAAALLAAWRLMQSQSGSLTTAGANGESRHVGLKQPPIWAADGQPWRPWLRVHLGPLAQLVAFLAGAAVLLLLGAHGTTATLATLALIATAVANSGPLL